MISSVAPSPLPHAPHFNTSDRCRQPAGGHDVLSFPRAPTWSQLVILSSLHTTTHTETHVGVGGQSTCYFNALERMGSNGTRGCHRPHVLNSGCSHKATNKHLMRIRRLETRKPAKPCSSLSPARQGDPGQGKLPAPLEQMKDISEQ